MIRNVLGLIIHFIGIGGWFIVITWLIVGIAIFVIPMVPLVFIVGYMTGIHTRTHKWDSFISFYGWEYLRKHYFKFSLHGSDEGIRMMKRGHDPVIMAIYPHGHFAITAAIYWGLNPTYKDRAVGAVHSILFYLPIIGTMIGWIGAISATKKRMLEVLRSGKSIYMTPGGVADITNRGNTVQKRTGFIRIAKEAGVPIIPIWCPDERSYYRHWSPLGDALKETFGFSIPTFICGRFWCPILPLSTSRSRICVGEPILWDGDKSVSDAVEEYYTKLSRLQTLNSMTKRVAEDGHDSLRDDDDDEEEFRNLLIIPCIPNEVAKYILGHLQTDPLMRCSSVNRLWRTVTLGLVTELRSVPYYTSHLLLPQMPNLKKLRLFPNDFIPKDVLKNLTSLTSLHVSGEKHLDDSILSHLKGLRKLVICGCINVTGRGLCSLKNLVFLVISDTFEVSFPEDALLPELKDLIFINTMVLPSLRNRIKTIAPKLETLRDQSPGSVRMTNFNKEKN